MILKVACPLLQAVSVMISPLPTGESSLTTQFCQKGLAEVNRALPREKKLVSHTEHQLGSSPYLMFLSHSQPGRLVAGMINPFDR